MNVGIKDFIIFSFLPYFSLPMGKWIGRALFNESRWLVEQLCQLHLSRFLRLTLVWDMGWTQYV